MDQSSHTVRFWKAQKKIHPATYRELATILIEFSANETFAASQGLLALSTEKQGVPGPNRGIIAGVLLQVARLNHLKSEHFDPDALWRRVHGDVTLLRELVELFDSEVPGMLARIQKAIKHGSPSDLEKASHKIKGSMLQFSAHAAAAVALQLEEIGRIGSMAGTESLVQILREEIAGVQQTLHAMVRDGAQR